MTTATSSRRLGARSYFAHPLHGPLPALLLLLTVGTGLIDAVSILGLGRVFIANMTGNVVFIGFAVAGAPGYSLWGSVVALAGFLLGASAGGIAISRFGRHRGRLLRNALAVQSAIFLAALALSLTGGASLTVTRQVLIVGIGAAALGIQNAVVRHLAVPDMTTTVLTMTLTGIASDLRKRDLATAARRTLAVIAMLVGAVIGALLVLKLGVSAGIAAVNIVLAVTLIGAAIASRRNPRWAIAGTTSSRE